ncbi:MAG: DUF2442 domain-containing protein [Acidobacteriota bacterium]|nr:MAG: DUF2442 domain-containing protein [Acidobacteriota bacterium]
MNSSAAELKPLAEGVRVTPDELVVLLVDGRTVTIPLFWFPRLANASEKERNNWELLGGGVGIHWPDVDEDLSVSGLLAGGRPPT